MIPSLGIISCPSCSLGPHTIALTDADISAMRAAGGHVNDDVPVDVVTKASKAASKFLVPGELLPLLPIRQRKCKNCQYQIELTT